MPPSIDGQYVFGLACSVKEMVNPSAIQITTFFGVNGSLSLMGGTRGRVFAIKGVLFAPYDSDDQTTIYDLNSLEANLRSFADGLAHTLVDTSGRSWSNVVWDGTYQTTHEQVNLPTDLGWCRPYGAMMKGLF